MFRQQRDPVGGCLHTGTDEELRAVPGDSPGRKNHADETTRRSRGRLDIRAPRLPR